jgi:hypothetical protein
MAGRCEHGYEPLGSMKYEKFLDRETVLASQEGLCSME